ncbi:MAG: alpha/beta fold hydrolase [Lentisphaeria bacterium]|nr:alpha/beta fold hydrolase [Lentisphaeria bacterium]
MSNQVKVMVTVVMSILLGLTPAARPQPAVAPPPKPTPSPVRTNQDSIMQDSARQAFRHMAAGGTLADSLARRNTRNLVTRTMGGEIFWRDLDECCGWRIQQNALFHNCRILDSENVRHAWGGLEYIEELLLGNPPSRLSNYAEPGYRFYPYPAEKAPCRGKIVLMHGLGNRAHNMSRMAKKFAAAGYDVRNYDYPTFAEHISTHGRRFLSAFRAELAATAPGTGIYFLTHSLGGIVLRVALAEMTPDECGRIKSIVMMAPPNRGSYWPDVLVAAIPAAGRLSKTLGDLRTGHDSPVNRIPPPAGQVQIGIVRAKMDLKVAAHQTELKDLPGCPVATVSGGHWQLPLSDEAFQTAETFFRTGAFPAPTP